MFLVLFCLRTISCIDHAILLFKNKRGLCVCSLLSCFCFASRCCCFFWMILLGASDAEDASEDHSIPWHTPSHDANTIRILLRRRRRHICTILASVTRSIASSVSDSVLSSSEVVTSEGIESDIPSEFIFLVDSSNGGSF